MCNFLAYPFVVKMVMISRWQNITSWARSTEISDMINFDQGGRIAFKVIVLKGWSNRVRGSSYIIVVHVCPSVCLCITQTLGYPLVLSHRLVKRAEDRWKPFLCQLLYGDSVGSSSMGILILKKNRSCKSFGGPVKLGFSMSSGLVKAQKFSRCLITRC